MVLKTNKAVRGRGFKLEWRRSGAYEENQKIVSAYSSWNSECTCTWPNYVSDHIGINGMSMYAFPKGNQSESHHVMKLAFDDIIFDQSYGTRCTNEFMVICSIENGVLQILDT